MPKDHELSLNIQTSQGTWQNAVFDKATKVQDVITAVIKHFGFDPGGNFQLQKDDGTPMKPERTLVSYHLADGDTLQFADLGGGVCQ